MASQYTRDHIKISLVKTLQTLGWHSINTTPLEVLTDILSGYIMEMCKTTNDYANEFGQTEPNLDHLGLAFREMGVDLQELEEYVTNVTFGQPPAPVPKYPLPRESHLNFLKPGSKEVVTRPVHIHEHLPPMYPLLEGSENESEPVVAAAETEEGTPDSGKVFKKPADVSPIEFKRTRKEEEGSRPTREISSVMMTTSGFISPAREGKLPESRTPIQAQQILDPLPPVNPISTGMPTNPEPVKPPNKKLEKKKDKVHKELFKSDENVKPTKKTSSMKDVIKMKHIKSTINSVATNSCSDNGNKNHLQIQQPTNTKVSQNKMNKTLAAARLKTEKLNTTITPIPMKNDQVQQQNQTSINGVTNNVNNNNIVGKLFTEPDKKKANILKKISNVKNEKHDKFAKKFDENRSRPTSSADLIIDETDDIVNKMNLPSDITIEPINPVGQYSKSPDKVDSCYFDDGSPPGTPSTPKTPELISHSPPLMKEKRKRKDSRRVRKIHKTMMPDTDIVDVELNERPKTPEAEVIMKQEPPRPHLLPPMPQFPFLPNFGGPGLIPPPLSNPLFPYSLPNFGKNMFMPSGLPPLQNFLPLPPKPTEEPPQPPPTMFNEVIGHDSPPHTPSVEEPTFKPEKKLKEHKKDKKDKIKKKNKKDKIKNKEAKKKLKEEKKDKLKKEKKEKRKEKELMDVESTVPKILLKIGSPSPRPETPDTIKKLNIKPIIKKDNEPTNGVDERKRESSPGLAKISALVTGPPKPKIQTIDEVHEEISPVPVPRHGPGPGRPRIHPIKTKPPPATKTKKQQRRTPVKKDAHGVEVWICPACGKQDDGSPMIGCDGCDAWYHWVCVGIQIPPDETENWYCRYCILKKNEDLQSDKKKKRKKREKKEH